MTELKDRLQWAITHAETNASQLAKATESSRASVSSWLSGGTKSIRSDKLALAATALGVRAHWLATGEGEPLAESGEQETERGLPKGKYAFIKRHYVQAAAGNGRVNDEFSESQDLAFRKDWLAREGLSAKDLAVIEVSGDSMLPRLHDGDLILINTTCTEIQSGKVYAIMYGPELKVKRLSMRYDGSLIIKSDNPSPDYEDEVIPAHDLEMIKVVGRVVKLVAGGGF